MKFIEIDGSTGEGGGQILRTCLSLSLLTGKPFTLFNIRKNRTRPGLRPQHISSIMLASKIGIADTTGDNLNSSQVTFSPKQIHPGKYKINIGTAGSTSLVLQSIYLPLGFTSSESSIIIEGGTHVPWSPTYDFLQKQWRPMISRIGCQVDLKLERAGYFPQGGGQINVKVKPKQILSGLQIPHRGRLKRISGISSVSNLNRDIAVRQRSQVVRRIGHKYPLSDIRIVKLKSRFKGTSICLICEFEHSQCSYSALGKKGKPAEEVADEVVEKIIYFMETDAVLDEYSADQLLLPLSFAETNSNYSTPKVTQHLVTNAKIISKFISTRIILEGDIDSPGSISIVPK